MTLIIFNHGLLSLLLDLRQLNLYNNIINTILISFLLIQFTLLIPLCMENLKKFFSLFSGSPSWIRIIVSVILAVLVALTLLSSCGQTVKVTVRDSPSGVSITTSQSKQDSSGTYININPNIQPYAK